MIKDKCKILISIIITVVIIILPCISNAEDDSEEQGATHLYTMEDIIFNRIPILNVNVFERDDAPEDSITMKIREAIATWYVSFTRIAVVLLGGILIYIGIRLALSTVANDRANYKKMLVNWLTAVIIVFFIHLIIVAVFEINDTLISTLDEINDSSEFPIYETIRTRTKDLRLSVGLPAAVIYWALVIISILFLWVYIKRLFTVMVLIVIAPFVGTKYAIEGASKGQRTRILTSWIYEFAINVLIQPIHAVLYIVLMSVALELATTTIIGFILALVFMNFILKADKIFMKVFNFDKKSRLIKDVAEPQKNLKEEFASAMLVGGMAKDSIKLTTGMFTKGTKAIQRVARRKYYKEANDENSKINQMLEKKNRALDKVDNKLNDIYKKVRKKDNQHLILAVMSRRKGLTGKVAKQKLKLAKKQRKERFTAPFKFIVSAGGKILMIGFSLPVGVVNPGAGLGMAIGGATGIYGMASEKDKKGNRYTGIEGLEQAATLGGYGRHKQMAKDKSKMDLTVDYLNEAMQTEDEIERLFREKFDNASEEAMKKYKQEIEYLLKYADDENINLLLRQNLASHRIISIDENNIDAVVEEMSAEIFDEIGIGKQYSKDVADKIRYSLVSDAKNAFQNKMQSAQNAEFSTMDLAKSFSNSIVSNGVSSEVDFDYMDKMFTRTLAGANFDNMDVNEIERTVNRFVKDLVKDMKLQNRGKDGIEDDIKYEANRLAKRFMEQKRKEMGTSSNFQNTGKETSNKFGDSIEGNVPTNPNANSNKFSDTAGLKDGVVKIVQEVVERKGKESGVEFGFGDITESIFDLKKINDKAKKDTKTSVVNVSRFVNNL